MFEIYCDESGNANRIVIGGFVATVDNWARCSKRWADIRTKYQISHFHSHSFRSRQSRFYRHLSRSDRRNLLAEVIGAIRDHVLFGVSLELDVRMFNRLTDAAYRTQCGSAYAFAVACCVRGLAGEFLTMRGTREEHVSVFIESGHRNANDAIQRLLAYKQASDPIDLNRYDHISGGPSKIRNSALKLDAVALADKISVPPLQAADLLAYCSASKGNTDKAFSELVGRSIAERVPVIFLEMNEAEVSMAVESTRRYFAEDSRLLKKRKGQKKTLKELGIPFSESGEILEIQFPDAITDEEIKSVMARLEDRR